MPLKNSLPKLRQTLSTYLDQRIVSDPTIDSHIKKLADLLPDQERIQSIYGAGYRYDPQDRVVD